MTTPARTTTWRSDLLVLAGMGICLVLLPPRPAAATQSGPCATNAEGRELDYWLGNWVVTTGGSSGSSTSTVSLSLDKCVVVEHWRDGKGHEGANMFGYSADDRRWRGFFADNHARVHVFRDGTVAAASAEFRGESGGREGASVLDRVRVVRTAPNRIEQTWDKSTDGGATWSTVFRGVYTRQQP